MKTRVFVYGTLMRDGVNNYLLRDQDFVGAATTMPFYDLLDLGGYPGLVRGGRRCIEGEVWGVDDKTLARMDRLEGVPHMYRREVVSLADTDDRSVFAYFYNVRGRRPPTYLPARWVN